MLLPRPEIRIATRRGSGIVVGDPILRRAPASCGAADRAATLPSFDAADAEDGLACAFQLIGHMIDDVLSNDDDHADAAVEGARHLLRSDRAALTQEFEHRRELPTRSIDDCASTLRQGARDV